MIFGILGHGYLKLETEDSLYDFISEGATTNREMFGLLEFVRLEYCLTDVMNDFFGLLSEHFDEINPSMWAGLRARLVLPNGTWRQFPPSVKKGRQLNVPNGIIGHLTRGCGGNVHDRNVVAVISGSFEKMTRPPSDDRVAKNAVDLETASNFESSYRSLAENIPHTKTNWLYYDFKDRIIIPTHCAIRSNQNSPGQYHMKSWLVEKSADGQHWHKVERKDDNKELNGPWLTQTFAVAG
jgi:hypothetical protein